MEGNHSPSVIGLVTEMFGQLDLWYSIMFIPILVVALWGRHKYPLVVDILRASNLVIAIFGLYLLVVFVAGFFSMDGHFEEFAFVNRVFGPYWYFFWINVVGCILIPQLAWIPRIGNSLWFFIALLFLINAVFIIRMLVFGGEEYLQSSWTSMSSAELILMEYLNGMSALGRMFYMFLLVGITLLLNRVLRKRSQGQMKREFDPMAYSTSSENPTTAENK